MRTSLWGRVQVYVESPLPAWFEISWPMRVSSTIVRKPAVIFPGYVLSFG